MNSRRISMATLAAVVLLRVVSASAVFGAGKPAKVDVIIGFNSAPGDALIQGLGGTINSRYSIIPARAATVPAGAVAALQRNPNVAYVETDGFKEYHTDSAVGELQWGTNRIDAEAVWDAAAIDGGNSGAGVLVADLDTGIDADHPDLAANVLETWSVAGKPDAGSPSSNANDRNGHGSATVGVIGAVRNSSGVVGVAPDVSIIAIQISKGSRLKTSDIIDGIELAVLRGAQVANMSFGGGFSQAEANAITAASNAGLVLVASPSNSSGGSVGYPAALTEVIAVSASTITDTLASFSNVGFQVEMIAPGANIYTTYKDGAYVHINGTSFSAPAVAGVAALVLAGGATSDQVRGILTSTAENIDLSGSQQGGGLVDAENAVLGTTAGDNLPPAGPTPLEITTTSLPNGTVGQAYSATLAADGGATPYTWAITGTLPTGLSLNASTGEISGTTSAEETSNFTAEVTDDDGATDTQALSITVSTEGGGGTFSLSVSYSTEGGRRGDKHLLITFAASDGSNPVSGATFSHTLSSTAGGSWGPVSGTTGAGGTTTFTLKNARSGTYSVEVHSATHSTLDWDGASPINTITK